MQNSILLKIFSIKIFDYEAILKRNIKYHLIKFKNIYNYEANVNNKTYSTKHY
jgi:hypothetical protein